MEPQTIRSVQRTRAVAKAIAENYAAELGLVEDVEVGPVVLGDGQHQVAVVVRLRQDDEPVTFNVRRRLNQ